MRVIITVISIILSYPCYADSSNYLLGGVGINESIVNPEFDTSNVRREYDTFSLQGFVGRRFNNNIQLEFGYTQQQNLDILGILDEIDISEFLILTGYRLDISEHFKLVPRVGISRWKIKSSEGYLFNSGPEQQSSVSGSNTIFMLSAFVDIIYITYQTTDYDYGLHTSLIIGVEIEL